MTFVTNHASPLATSFDNTPSEYLILINIALD